MTEIGRLPIRLKLDPGQAGTLKLLREYGEALVCVRYRYDLAARCRHKTVELVVETAPWWPGRRRLKPDTWVAVETKTGEINIHNKLRRHGGQWDSRRRLWWVKYIEVCRLNLEDRILFGEAPRPSIPR